MALLSGFLKKHLNASRPSEHPPVRGENVKTFRWDHHVQTTTVLLCSEHEKYRETVDLTS